MRIALAAIACACAWTCLAAPTAPARGASALDAIVSLGDSLAAAGLHDDAITEYMRALFVDPGYPARSGILSRIAFSSARLDRWKEAREAIDKAVRSAASDSSRECAEMDRAVILIAAGAPTEARADLELLARCSALAESRRRAGFLLLTAEVLSAEWSGALSSYRSYIKGTDAGNDSLEAALEAAASRGRLSPGMAVALSIFIPGSGQIYAGRWRSGLGALAVNGGFGYLVATSIARGNYAAGIVEFLLLLRRYYLGNLQNAAAAAATKNEVRDARLRRETLDMLRSVYGQPATNAAE